MRSSLSSTHDVINVTPFTITFTTAAFDRSSLWLFEASPYRATPKALPSSFVRHDASRLLDTTRSSNRTCGFPASGFRTRSFMLSPTEDCASCAQAGASPALRAGRSPDNERGEHPDSGAYRSTTGGADDEPGCPRPDTLGSPLQGRSSFPSLAASG